MTENIYGIITIIKKVKTSGERNIQTTLIRKSKVKLIKLNYNSNNLRSKHFHN